MIEPGESADYATDSAKFFRDLFTTEAFISQEQLEAVDSRAALEYAIGATASAENAVRRGNRDAARERMTLGRLWLEISDRLDAREAAERSKAPVSGSAAPQVG